MIHLTFYTDKLPEGVAGAANGPFIRIRPEHKDDVGIKEHELEHVRQWWVCTILSAPILFFLNPVLVGLCIGIHPIMYLAIKRYRLWCEAEAYKIQMNHPDKRGGFLSLATAAKLLMSPRYRLGLSQEEAVAALS